MKLKSFLEDISNNEIVLPNFQRGMEWKVENQKRLLASVLVKIPIGSFLLLRGKSNDFSAKEICFINKVPKIQNDKCNFLLDGQQRISTLKSMLYDFFDNVNKSPQVLKGIYPNLRYRWYLRIKPNDDEEDIFGFRNMQLNNIDTLEPEQIKPFIVHYSIKTINKKSWYNPGYIPNNGGNSSLNSYHLAKKTSEKYLVPLYSLYGSNSSEELHKKVLINIAEERAKELTVISMKSNEEINRLFLGKKPPDEIKKMLNEIDPVKKKETISNEIKSLSFRWAEQLISYLDSILTCDLHTIIIDAKQINRAVAIFESINKGGTPLSTFDLIAARAARSGSKSMSLREKIFKEIRKGVSPNNAIKDGLTDTNGIPNNWVPTYFGVFEDEKLANTTRDQFLNLISILSYIHSHGIGKLNVSHIKRSYMLNLSDKQIISNTPKAVKALNRAFIFLHLRCGVLNINKIPYELMVVPIGYALLDDKIWNSEASIAKIEYWYWGSIFSGKYRAEQNTRCINDLKDLHSWLNGVGSYYDNLIDDLFEEKGLTDIDVLLMRDKNNQLKKPIYDSIIQYILSRQPKDLLSSPNDTRLNTWDISKGQQIVINNNYVDLSIEEHHIIPLASAKNLLESTKNIRSDKGQILNSPLNLTPVSKTANNYMASKTPNEYFQHLSNVNIDRHFIPNPGFLRKSNETDPQYYERAIKERFDVLKIAINKELDDLKSK